MNMDKVTWNKVYHHIKQNNCILFFYRVADKRYYSLDSNFVITLHRVNKNTKIVKEKEAEFNSPSISIFCDYMNNKYPLSTFILSPTSQMKLYESEAECVDAAVTMRDQLRKMTTSIVGESSFRSLSAEFSKKGLNGDFNSHIGELEIALIGWVEELENGHVFGLQSVFLIYDKLSYPDCVRELHSASLE